MSVGVSGVHCFKFIWRVTPLEGANQVLRSWETPYKPSREACLRALGTLTMRPIFLFTLCVFWSVTVTTFSRVVLTGQSQTFESIIDIIEDDASNVNTETSSRNAYRMTVGGRTGEHNVVELLPPSSDSTNRSYESTAWVDLGTIEYTWDIPTVTRVPRMMRVLRGRTCKLQRPHAMANAPVFEGTTKRSTSTWASIARDFRIDCPPLERDTEDVFRDLPEGCRLHGFPHVTPYQSRLNLLKNQLDQFLNQNPNVFTPGIRLGTQGGRRARREVPRSKNEAIASMQEGAILQMDSLFRQIDTISTGMRDIYRMMGQSSQLILDAGLMARNNSLQILRANFDIERLTAGINTLALQKKRQGEALNLKIGSSVMQMQDEMQRTRDVLSGLLDRSLRQVYRDLLILSRQMQSFQQDGELRMAYTVRSTMEQIETNFNRMVSALNDHRREFLDLQQKVTHLYEAFREDYLDRNLPLSVALDVFSATRILREENFIPLLKDNEILPRNLSQWTAIGFRRWNLHTVNLSRCADSTRARLQELARRQIDNHLRHHLLVRAWVPYARDPRFARWTLDGMMGTSYFLQRGTSPTALGFTTNQVVTGVANAFFVDSMPPATARPWVLMLATKGYDSQGLREELRRLPRLNATLLADAVVVRDGDQGFIRSAQLTQNVNDPPYFLRCLSEEETQGTSMVPGTWVASLQRPEHPFTFHRINRQVLRLPHTKEFYLRSMETPSLCMRVDAEGYLIAGPCEGNKYFSYNSDTWALQHRSGDGTLSCLTLNNNLAAFNAVNCNRHPLRTEGCGLGVAGQKFHLIPVDLVQGIVKIHRLPCCNDSLTYGTHGDPLMVTLPTAACSNGERHLFIGQDQDRPPQHWKLVFRDEDEHSAPLQGFLSPDLDEDGDSLGVNPPIKFGQPIRLSTPACGGRNLILQLYPTRTLQRVELPDDSTFRPEAPLSPTFPQRVTRSVSSPPLLDGRTLLGATTTSLPNQAFLGQCLGNSTQNNVYVIVEAPRSGMGYTSSRTEGEIRFPALLSNHFSEEARLGRHYDYVAVPRHLAIERLAAHTRCLVYNVQCQVQCRSNNLCTRGGSRMPTLEQRVESCNRYFNTSPFASQWRLIGGQKGTDSPQLFVRHNTPKTCSPGWQGANWNGECLFNYESSTVPVPPPGDTPSDRRIECPAAFSSFCRMAPTGRRDEDESSTRTEHAGTRILRASCLQCPQGYEKVEDFFLEIKDNQALTGRECARDRNVSTWDSPLELIDWKKFIDHAPAGADYTLVMNSGQRDFWHMCLPQEHAHEMIPSQVTTVTVTVRQEEVQKPFTWTTAVIAVSKGCASYDHLSCPENRCRVVVDAQNSVAFTGKIFHRFRCEDASPATPNPCSFVSREACVSHVQEVSSVAGGVEVPLCAWDRKENENGFCRPLVQGDLEDDQVDVHCKLYDSLDGGSFSPCLQRGADYCIVYHQFVMSDGSSDSTRGCRMKPQNDEERRTLCFDVKKSVCEYATPEATRRVYATFQGEYDNDPDMSCLTLSESRPDIQCETRLSYVDSFTGDLRPRCRYIGVDERCVSDCEYINYKMKQEYPEPNDQVSTASSPRAFLASAHECLSNRLCMIDKGETNVFLDNTEPTPRVIYPSWTCLWQWDLDTISPNRGRVCDGAQTGQYTSRCIRMDNRCHLLEADGPREPLGTQSQTVVPFQRTPCYEAGFDQNNPLFRGHCLAVFNETEERDQTVYWTYSCKSLPTFIEPAPGLCPDFQTDGYCDATEAAEMAAVNQQLNQFCELQRTQEECINVWNPRTQSRCAWAHVEGIGRCFDDDDYLVELQMTSRLLQRVTFFTEMLRRRHIGSVVTAPLGPLLEWIQQAPNTELDALQVRILQADVTLCPEATYADPTRGLYCQGERNRNHPQVIFSNYWESALARTNEQAFSCIADEKYILDVVYACKVTPVDRAILDSDSPNAFVCLSMVDRDGLNRLSLQIPADMETRVEVGPGLRPRTLFPLQNSFTLEMFPRQDHMWRLEALDRQLVGEDQEIQLGFNITTIRKIGVSQLWNAEWVDPLTDKDMTGAYEQDIIDVGDRDIEALRASWIAGYGDHPQLWGIQLPEGVVLKDIPPGTYQGQAYGSCRGWSISYMRPETLPVRKYMNPRVRCSGTLTMQERLSGISSLVPSENCQVDNPYESLLPRSGDLFIHHRDTESPGRIFNIPSRMIQVSGAAQQRCGQVGYVHSQGEQNLTIEGIFRSNLLWDPECASASPTTWSTPRNPLIQPTTLWQLRPLALGDFAYPYGNVIGIPQGSRVSIHHDCRELCEEISACSAYLWDPCDPTIPLAICLQERPAVCTLFSEILYFNKVTTRHAILGTKQGSTVQDWCGRDPRTMTNTQENVLHRLRRDILSTESLRRWSTILRQDFVNSENLLGRFFEEWATHWEQQDCPFSLSNFYLPGEERDQFYLWYTEAYRPGVAHFRETQGFRFTDNPDLLNERAHEQGQRRVFEAMAPWTTTNSRRVQCGRCRFGSLEGEDIFESGDPVVLCDPAFGMEPPPVTEPFQTLLTETSAQHEWCMMSQAYDIFQDDESTVTFRLHAGLGRIQQTFSVSTDRIARLVLRNQCPLLDQLQCHPALGSPCSVRFRNPLPWSLSFELRMRGPLQNTSIPVHKMVSPGSCDSDLPLSVAPNDITSFSLPICQGRFQIQLWSLTDPVNCTDILDLNLFEYTSGQWNNEDNAPPLITALTDTVFDRLQQALAGGNESSPFLERMDLSFNQLNTSIVNLRQLFDQQLLQSRNDLLSNLNVLQSNVTDVTAFMRGFENRVMVVEFNISSAVEAFRDSENRFQDLRTNVQTLQSDLMVSRDQMNENLAQAQDEYRQIRQDNLEAIDQFRRLANEETTVKLRAIQSEVSDMVQNDLDDYGTSLSRLTNFAIWSRSTSVGLIMTILNASTFIISLFAVSVAGIALFMAVRAYRTMSEAVRGTRNHLNITQANAFEESLILGDDAVEEIAKAVAAYSKQQPPPYSKEPSKGPSMGRLIIPT